MVDSGSAGLRACSRSRPGNRSLRRVQLRSAVAAQPVQLGIVGLLLDASGQLWADTPIGLHRLSAFDGESTIFSSISARLGAVGVPFGANLLQDREGRIWSQRFVYDPRSDSLYELGRADGADLGTPWFRAYAATRDGQLLFGGSKGLMVVDPTRFRRWEFKPPLAVTELKVGGALVPLVDPAWILGVAATARIQRRVRGAGLYRTPAQPVPVPPGRLRCRSGSTATPVAAWPPTTA